MSSLRELIAVLDRWYPPVTAEAWDSVGLTCGDPDATVNRVLLAVDCVPATVEQAISSGAQLLLTHHPLLLTPVNSVANIDPKAQLVHRLVRAGIGHFSAHTNADIAVDGVSSTLAELLGVSECVPLVAAPAPSLDQLSVFVPLDYVSALLSALSEAGAGALGDYDQCSFTVEGVGTYRPLSGANPHDGEIGRLSRKPEARVTTILPRSRRAQVLAAMRSAHPYEEVAFELSEQPAMPGPIGSGRIGTLTAAITLGEFTARVARLLPATVWGVRAAGSAHQPVRTVAVCGGSGGSYTDIARRAGADVFVTADLKHHAALENVTERTAVVAGSSKGTPDQHSPAPMALIDAAHWATEHPWLTRLAERLAVEFGSDLGVEVSQIVTDPWTIHQD